MEVIFIGCDHVGTVEDGTKVMLGNMVEGLCPRCLSVESVDDLFVGYPSLYFTRYGGYILAKIKEIHGDLIVVATSQFKPGSLNYREWRVCKSNFRKQGTLFVADPFGTVK